MRKKNYPLRVRLDTSLALTSTEEDKNLVYGRLYRCVLEITNYTSPRDFYRKHNRKTLVPKKTKIPLNSNEIKSGKELALSLKENIARPNIIDKKKVWKKMEEIIDCEFVFLTEEINKYDSE